MDRKQKGKVPSAAAAAASRRNGAQSRGPRTAAGKALASRNALKHGLFSRPVPGTDLPGSPQVLAALAGMDEAGWQTGIVQDALFADWQLLQATHLLARLDSEINTLLASGASDPTHLSDLLAQRARIGRYQRRFRGNRDHLLRQLLGFEPRDGEVDDREVE